MTEHELLEYRSTVDEELEVASLDLLPETETDGLKHLFCCQHINVTYPTTA